MRSWDCIFYAACLNSAVFNGKEFSCKSCIHYRKQENPSLLFNKDGDTFPVVYNGLEVKPENL